MIIVGHPSFRPADLRCEYLVDPINVGAVRPRLSWIDEAQARNWRQGGYQILVSSDRKALESDRGDLWDTGRVGSRETTQIAYAGKPLISREACWWKVRVWDSEGKASAWSSPYRWEMGLLSGADWRDSTWIGKKGPAEANPAPYLRTEFTVAGKVRRARIYACGLGYAEIHANCRPVAPGLEREPGYTNFDKRVLSVAYNVSSLIKPGRNAVGAILGTGWYDVHDKATWNFDRAPWRDRPKLRLLLAIDTDDGKTQFVTSCGSWKLSTGPILRDGIYTGEVYDARKELTGWDRPGFDASGWIPTDEMAAPKGELIPRACPPVAIEETIRAKRITEPKPGVYVVDFGQNFAGHARLKLNAPAGTEVRMRYSERLDKTGMIERSQIEQFMAKQDPPQPFQSDTYICRGASEETWEQRFSYSGFRYMEVTGLPSKPSLDSFEGRFAHTDLEGAGSFSCSDETLNRIQSATRYSYLSNAQDIPTDCPQREKNGWTGDAQLAAEAGLMNFRSAPFYTKWLDDLADTESSSGMMSIIVPTGGWGRGARHPAWDSAFPIVAYDLYRYEGDQTALAKHYEGLKLYVDSLAGELKDGVLTFDSLGDWLPWQTETPSTYTSTVYLYADAEILRKTAAMLGNTADEAHFADLAKTVREGFNRRFFVDGSADSSRAQAWASRQRFPSPFQPLKGWRDQGRGIALLNGSSDKTANGTTYNLPGPGAPPATRSSATVGPAHVPSYANGSQTALSMALDFDLVPAERRAQVFAALVRNVETQGHIDTGILGAKYVLRVLSEGGRADLAYRLVARKEQPSWAWWIEQGATTLWEDWKGESSLNHIMFGDVSNWFIQWIAGIGLDEGSPGFSHIQIHPQIVGGLTWAKATHQSPHGLIASSWKMDSEGFHLDVTIPANATATVAIPYGTTVTEGGHSLSSVSEVRLLDSVANHIVVQVGSGTYRFLARP